MNPRRRLLLATVAVLVAVAAAVTGLRAVRTGEPVAAARQDRPGPVLLVPGYGGGTVGLEVLAAALRADGRSATVVPAVGDGTGDLAAAADALGVAVDEALAGSGAGSVDLVGYSAGGVVARLWAEEHPGRVRRVVTLGSPHHGTRVAALGAVFSPGGCPVACRQLVPGSPLLDTLNDGDETPDGPVWLSLWTTDDEVVTPPESARLDGAVNVALQDVCPGLRLGHGELPTSPLVRGIVREALSVGPVAQPGAADCARLSS